MNADLVLTAIAWIWVAAGAGLVGFSFYVLHEDGFPDETVALFALEAMILAATSSLVLPLYWLGFQQVALWTWRIAAAIALVGALAVNMRKPRNYSRALTVGILVLNAALMGATLIGDPRWQFQSGG